MPGPPDPFGFISLELAVDKVGTAMTVADRADDGTGNNDYDRLIGSIAAESEIMAQCQAGTIRSVYRLPTGRLINIPPHRWGSNDVDDFFLFGYPTVTTYFGPQLVEHYPIFVEARGLKQILLSLSKRHSAARAHGGRPKEHDWEAIKTEAFRLMDYHGDFTPSDREWNAQARLEEALNQFCQVNWAREPGTTTLRRLMAPWLAEWRKTRTRGS